MTTTDQPFPTMPDGTPITGTRPLTPDERDEATKTTTVRVKRLCNGCEGVIGDVNQEELSATLAQRPLPDVRGECLRCTPAVAPA